MTRLPVTCFASLLILIAPSVRADKSKVQKAKSVGNDQTTFTMTLKSSDCPFCNLTEATLDGFRLKEAGVIPALIQPGYCELTNQKWELNSDPFVRDPFISNGQWSPDTSGVWNNVAFGIYSKTSFDSTLAEDAAAKANQVVLKDLPEKVGIGSLAWVDKDTSSQELVEIVGVKSESKTLTIQGATKSGFQFDHPAEAKITIIPMKTAGCVAGKADLLLQRAFRYGFCDSTRYNVGQPKVLSPSFELTSADYYIVNVVAWDKNDTNYLVSSSDWYVYNRGDHGKWYRQPLPNFTSLRIYGSEKQIGLVAIHIAPPGDWKAFQQFKISYTVSVKAKTAQNVADLTTALQIALGSQGTVSEKKKDPDGFYGAMFFRAKAPADISINSEVGFPKTGSTDSTAPSHPSAQLLGDVPRPSRSVDVPKLRLVNLGFDTTSHKDGLSVLKTDGQTTADQSGGGGSSTGGKNAQGNGNPPQQGTKSTNQSNPPPTPNPSADCQPSTSGGQQAPCKFAATINDENLYYWDVSFGVPVKTITELQYVTNATTTTNTNTIVAKSVTRLNAYAFLDIYPVASDIVTPGIVSIPHIVLGLPISGKVFNKPFFGAGESFNLTKVGFLKFIPLQFGFFGGLVYDKEFRQIPGTIGSSNVSGHRVWSSSLGVEIPVSQFKSLLTSKSKNSSSNTPGKTTSDNTSGS
jgi:hypothetical protein